MDERTGRNMGTSDDHPEAVVSRDRRARLVGFNHVALEVGDIEAALEFYGRLFELKLRGRGTRMAFVDAGDQFLALSEGRTQPPDDDRHIGMAVDDREALREALKETDAEILPGDGLDFLDPWGNHWQVVEYENVQFTKALEILDGMGMSDLQKTDTAIAQLRAKGLWPG
jgi:lactoylglutathione lyase